MQSRTWEKIWSEVERIVKIANVDSFTETQQRIVESVVNESVPTPPRRKKRKVIKKRAKKANAKKQNTDQTEVAVGTTSPAVEPKKRGRPRKAVIEQPASNESGEKSQELSTAEVS